MWMGDGWGLSRMRYDRMQTYADSRSVGAIPGLHVAHAGDFVFPVLQDPRL